MASFNIPYGRQEITESDKKAVLEALEHPFITQGPKVSEFEEKFADYVGSKYAVAVSNGTAALHLSAMALEVSSKDTVLTTPITFDCNFRGQAFPFVLRFSGCRFQQLISGGHWPLPHSPHGCAELGLPPLIGC